MKWITYCILLCCCLTISNCGKIIFLLSMASKSHKNLFRPLMHELANKGYEITVVSPFKDEKTVGNIHEIALNSNLELTRAASQELIDDLLEEKESMWNKLFRLSIEGTRNYLQNTEVQELLKEGVQFDIAVVHWFLNEVGLKTAYLLAKHVVLVSPNTMSIPTPSSPPFPLATVSSRVFRLPNDLNFIDRLKNVLGSTILWNVYKHIIYSPVEELCHEYNPKIPSIDEAMKGICLTFINADPVMAVAVPGMPNVVPIGGVHCKPAKALPEDLSDFVESSGEDGFLFFSLGSVMQGKFLPKKTQNEFLKAFSRLKQKVIWKFEENMNDLPTNVMVTSWAPQQDLIGHPKIRVFLTHGGLLSSQEATYHGAPVIGIPIFGDQYNNVDRLIELGIGETLDIRNITAEEVYSKIQKILQNPEYKSEIKRLSSIARDKAVTSMETAVYWLEYIIRHDGANYLRSSAEDLDYFVYFCLDILAIFSVATVPPLYISMKILCHLKKRFCQK